MEEMTMNLAPSERRELKAWKRTMGPMVLISMSDRIADGVTVVMGVSPVLAPR